MKEICVIGGGPSGVFAAYFAASKGDRVTIIERNEELMKKLLLTGNGKCNYSNSDLKSEYYNFGENHPFAEILEKYDSSWLENFFKERGMLTYQKDSLKYPRSERADTVKSILSRMINEKNIRIVFGKKVVSVEKNKGAKTEKKGEEKPVLVYNDKDSGVFVLTLENNEKIECDKLIIATGGKAYPSTGSDGAGYRLARELGHSVSFTYPVLTKLFVNDKDIKILSGVRYKAKVSAEVEGSVKGVESGEIQFTENGLSGICIFNLSRYLSKPTEDKILCSVNVDFLPETDENELKKYLNDLLQREKDKNLLSVLNTMFGEKIAGFIHRKIKEAGALSVSGNISFTDEELSKIAGIIKSFRFEIIGHDSFNNAQVTKGGVGTDEVNANMESKICPGLFFAGEVLDVDGKCGGYNLHWAFASGCTAGLSACGQEC